MGPPFKAHTTSFSSSRRRIPIPSHLPTRSDLAFCAPTKLMIAREIIIRLSLLFDHSRGTRAEFDNEEQNNRYEQQPTQHRRICRSGRLETRHCATEGLAAADRLRPHGTLNSLQARDCAEAHRARYGTGSGAPMNVRLDARDIARMVSMRHVFIRLGVRVRNSKRADCPLCKGNSTGTIAFTQRLCRCHRCNDAGAVLALLRAVNRCDFPSALRYIAQLAGIRLDDRQH